jgi:hypothetical protein
VADSLDAWSMSQASPYPADDEAEVLRLNMQAHKTQLLLASHHGASWI